MIINEKVVKDMYFNNKRVVKAYKNGKIVYVLNQKDSSSILGRAIIGTMQLGKGE